MKHTDKHLDTLPESPLLWNAHVQNTIRCLVSQVRQAMILRKVQAIGVELLVGFTSAGVGASSFTVNNSILYRLMQSYGGAIYWAWALVFSGVLLCLSSIAKFPKVRKFAALCCAAVWGVTGFAYIRAGEAGPIPFIAIVYFVSALLIATDGWE